MRAGEKAGTGGPRAGLEPNAPLDEVTVEVEARGIELLALDEALDALARIDGARAASSSCATSED